MLIHDVQLVTSLRQERAAVASDATNLEKTLKEVVSNSDTPEELLSFTVLNSREASAREEKDCAWLRLDEDGHHPWLDGGCV